MQPAFDDISDVFQITSQPKNAQVIRYPNSIMIKKIIVNDNKHTTMSTITVHLPFSLLLALWPLSLSSVMLATLRTGSADPRCSLSRLRSWFSRLKLRLVTWSRFRSRSSRLSSRLSNRSLLRFERSKSLRSRLELFLQGEARRTCRRQEEVPTKQSFKAFSPNILSSPRLPVLFYL